jgi:hypothetical protein
MAREANDKAKTWGLDTIHEGVEGDEEEGQESNAQEPERSSSTDEVGEGEEADDDGGQDYSGAVEPKVRQESAYDEENGEE